MGDTPAELLPAAKARSRGERPLSRGQRYALCGYAACAIVMGIFVFSAVNPGGLTNDSLFQLDQAQGRIGYNDWHPVIMSWTWSLLLKLAGTVASMAAVQVSFAVLLAVLLVYYLLLATRNCLISGLGFLLVAMPNTMNMWGMVWKDVHMVLTLALAVVCVLLIRFRPRFLWGFVVAALLLLTYAALVRKNSVVAVVPILVLLADQVVRVRGDTTTRKRIVGVTGLSLLVFGLLVGSTGALLDHTLHPTKNSQVEQVMLDDLIFAVPQKSIDGSDAPDRLKKKLKDARRECRAKGKNWNSYWVCYGTGASGAPFTAIADGDAVRKLWVEEIPTHLPQYITYRAWTTRELLFTTGLQFAGKGVAEHAGYPLQNPGAHDFLRAYVVDFGVTQLRFLYYGWFGLLISTAGAVMACIKRWRSPSALAIFVSGILYLLTFVPSAPAADYRYVFWTMLAGLLGWLVLLGERRARALRGAPPAVIGRERADGQLVRPAPNGRTEQTRSAQRRRIRLPELRARCSSGRMCRRWASVARARQRLARVLVRTRGV